MRIRIGEIVAGACALVLFIDMFLPWYSAGPFNANAWKLTYTDILLLLLVLVTLGLVALTATQLAPALPVAAGVIVTVLASVAALVVLGRIIDQPGPNEILSVEWGAYLGFLLCLGIAAGGFMSMRDERARR